MATRRRSREDGPIIHSDRGVQLTSWAFSPNVRDAGLAPSMGAAGSPYDSAMVEAFWGRMQVELLKRNPWKTSIQLAAAIHDYIERPQHPQASQRPRDPRPHRIRKPLLTKPNSPADSRTTTPRNPG